MQALSHEPVDTAAKASDVVTRCTSASFENETRSLPPGPYARFAQIPSRACTVEQSPASAAAQNVLQGSTRIASGWNKSVIFLSPTFPGAADPYTGDKAPTTPRRNPFVNILS